MGHFFIERPVMAIVIAILTVIIGAVSILGLPVAQFPEIAPPEIQVNTTYVGADALTIEQAVATPLEQQINGVDNMLYVRSINANDGTLSIRVTFMLGTNIDMDNVLTQNRVSQGSATLPVDVKNFGVTVKKSTSAPFMLVTIESPKSTWPANFLGNYATINVNDALLRVPGVGQLLVFGTADYAMRVWVKPEVLKQRGLTVEDLKNALKKQNTVNPAGQLGAEPAPKNTDFTYAVRAQGRLVTAEDFGEVVVRQLADGSRVYLKDVARIELGAVNYGQRARLNGKPAAIIALYQMPGSNALAVAAGIRKVMKELSQKFPDDVTYSISLDTTKAVEEGINEILHTLFEAIALVILVVFIFLQSWRATLIPLLTVPVALVGTFAIFPLLGFSVNTLSLFGLVLAIGLVVDDAIVVVEAVEHHIQHGLSPKEATKKAMTEVSGPVVAIALILAAVFVPVAFVPGITGQLYKQFALTIAVSVMLSAVNALSLSPALSVLLLKPRVESKGLLGRAFASFNKGFDATTGTYVKWTGLLSRKLILSMVILAAFTASAGFMGKRVAGGFVPDEDQGYFYVNVQLPDGSSLQRTDEVCKKVEAILLADSAIEKISTVAGFSIISTTSATYTGFFFVTMKDWAERKNEAGYFKTVLRRVNAEFAKIPEALVIGILPAAIPGLGTGGGFSLMLQDRAGGTVENLQKVTEEFIAAAKKRPEIGNIYTMFRGGVPQRFVHVDKEKALKQGVDLGELYGTLQTFMGGSYVNDFNRFGRQWKVYLGAEPEYRAREQDMGGFGVRNKNGDIVELSSLIDVTKTRGPEFTNRFNLFRAVELGGSPAPGYSSGQAMAALEAVAKENLTNEYGTSWNALSYQESVAPSSTGVFVMALIFVFLILAAQYESWSLPFSVLLCVPLAVAGSFVALLVAKLEFNVYAQIGLVMLIGLAAKNAILIVEFAKMEVEKGTPLLDAALIAAKLRLRPILMTAFAFILGCVPLLTAAGAGAESRIVLGTVVVYGMLANTILGVLLTPPLFVLFEKFFGKKHEPKPPGEAAPHDAHAPAGATP